MAPQGLTMTNGVPIHQVGHALQVVLRGEFNNQVATQDQAPQRCLS
jgi:hypothetical protein